MASAGRSGCGAVDSNIAIKPGSEVDYGERRFVIMQVISFEAVVARDVETGELERLPIADLRPVSSPEPSVLPPDLAELDDRDWAEARRRLDLIGPVLERARLPRSVMAEWARAGGVEVTTLYRWARAFRTTGLLSSLLPYKPAGGRGKSRLEPAVEQIVLRTIEEHFLTPQQRWIESTAAEVARRCRERQLSVPHAGTIRARIRALPLRERLSRRSHRKAALDRFAPRPGVLDQAPRPLDFVQIDHTKLDVIVVDEEQRLPIGRPWITLAIDVYSRMVLGFYISLDPPGAIATGLCIAHAVLPKETWLAKRGIIGFWPCWGFPARIHLISTTPRNFTARCCAGRASSMALCWSTARSRSRTWVATSNGSSARCCARSTSCPEPRFPTPSSAGATTPKLGRS